MGVRAAVRRRGSHRHCRVVPDGLPPDLRPLALALFAVCAAGTRATGADAAGGARSVSPATPALLASVRPGFRERPRLGAALHSPAEHGGRRGSADRPEPVPARAAGPAVVVEPFDRCPAALAIFVVPLALYGIYTREHNNGLIYGFWQPQDGGGGNQFGPFINRNHFGGWMLMTLGLLIGSLFGRLEGDAARAVPPDDPACWRGCPPGPRTVSSSRAPS